MLGCDDFGVEEASSGNEANADSSYIPCRPVERPWQQRSFLKGTRLATRGSDIQDPILLSSKLL
jgi:hypothetical protein